MTDQAASTTRAGQGDAPKGTERIHTLVVLVNDRIGAVDRVVGLLRRRRANMHTLVIAHSEISGVVRITVVVDDSEVGVDQLAEQLRKIVDVRHVVKLSSDQAVSRELALIKVNCNTTNRSAIIEMSHLFGAHAVDLTSETVTLEVTGSEEQVGKLIDHLQSYGIREVARTGSVAMARENDPELMI